MEKLQRGSALSSSILGINVLPPLYWAPKEVSFYPLILMKGRTGAPAPIDIEPRYSNNL
jgi:hypothetical protein